MKNILKKSLIYIFVCMAAVSLSSCNEGGTTAVKKEEAERLSHFPEPVEADEDGFYPLISNDLAEKYIFSKKGLPDREKPGADIPDFKKSKAANEYLETVFPYIDDWKVVYEKQEYYLRPDTYDPMSYSFRDMYLPSSVVILDTDEGEDFDRLVLSYFKSYYLFSEGEYCRPSEEISFNFHMTNKEDWINEEFSDAEILSDGMYASGLWFPKDKEALLFPENQEGVFIVKNAEEKPENIISIEKTGFILPFYENGERDYFALTGTEGNEKLYLYNSHDMTMTEFEGMSNIKVIPLEEGVFAINNGSSLNLYDLSREDFYKPFNTLTLPEEGSVIASVTTDRSSMESHALAYKENENWHIVLFDKKGEVQYSFPLEMKKSYLYDYQFNYNEGIIYIDDRILEDNYRFAININEEVGHDLHLVEASRERQGPYFKYVKPLYYPAIKGLTFESVEDIDFWPQIAERICDMTLVDERETFWTKFPGGRISPIGMTEYINFLFDVDEATVNKNSRKYLKGSSVYEYLPEEDFIPYDIVIEDEYFEGPKWEENTGTIVFSVFDEEKREFLEGHKFKVTVEKDESFPLGYKIISMVKI